MFQKMFDYGFQRDWKQAVGFYAVHLVLILVGCVIISGVMAGFGAIDNDDAFDRGIFLGRMLGSMIVGMLGFYILQQKNYGLDWRYGFVAVAVGLTFTVSLLIGLPFCAYLTTLPDATDTPVS